MSKLIRLSHALGIALLYAVMLPYIVVDLAISVYKGDEE